MTTAQVVETSGTVNNNSPIQDYVHPDDNTQPFESTDVIHLTMTLRMITTQVVKTSGTVNNNSPIQDYVHPDNHTQIMK